MPKDNEKEQRNTPDPGENTPSEEEAGQPSGQATSESPTSQSPRTDPETGGQTEFTNPQLAGRSPQEIESLFGIYENTVREQGSELSKLQREMEDLKTKVSSPPPLDEGEDDDFFSNPRAVVRSEIRKTLKSEMSEMMEPFYDDLKERKAVTAEQRIRSQYDDWDEVRPYVRAILQQKGLTIEDAAEQKILDATYWAVQGLRAKGRLPGSNNQGQQQPQQREQEGTRMQSPPQHRPSNAPMPPSEPQKPKRRELTENERRLAREYGMSHEEYLDWQELEGDEVVEASIGMED